MNEVKKSTKVYIAEFKEAMSDIFYDGFIAIVNLLSVNPRLTIIGQIVIYPIKVVGATLVLIMTPCLALIGIGAGTLSYISDLLAEGIMYTYKKLVNGLKFLKPIFIKSEK